MYDNYLEQNIEDRRSARFALVVFLPTELDEHLTPLRERYDPLWSLIPSHATVIFPFESRYSLDELTGMIQEELAREPVIPIRLGSIHDFYPRYPVICWKIQKNEQLNGIYYRLYSRLAMPIPFKEYHPHVTVAREISDHRVMLVKEKIVPYLSEEQFVARNVDLITPLPGNRWVSVRTFPLAGP
jgi:2'-5' RNA ligase